MEATEPVRKVAAPAKYKKAPDAPKRFKSAFIIFSAEKHKSIKEDLQKQGRAEKTTDIAKLVSEAWRELSPEEKEVWENKARQDKRRYEIEKSLYKGPWKIPANKRRPKDPTAPKRPMSAFLAFSNKRRAALKRQNPNATNADLSKMLSITWREAPEELRKKYMDEEAKLRADYKVEMATWRLKVAEEKKVERKEREAMALQAAEARDAQRAEQSVFAQGGGQYMGGDEANQGMMPQDFQAATAMQGMYNPYLAAGMAGGMGDMGSLGLQGGYGGGGGFQLNPFAAQLSMPGIQGMPGMQGGAAQQQVLLNQILANQQQQQMMQQRNPLAFYGQGQGLGGGGGGGFGSGGLGDMQAAQRAMMEAQQGGGAGGPPNPAFSGLGGGMSMGMQGQQGSSQQQQTQDDEEQE